MLPKKFNDCLERLRNGDKQAIKEIYIENYEKMTFAALSKVKNVAAAEDIASEFIMYIFENAAQIGYIEKPDSWLYKGVVNRAIDYVRKCGRTVSLLSIEETAAAAAEHDNDLICLLSDAFQNLTEREKEIFILHYIYGFKYQEIADTLYIPVGTIKRCVSEMKDKLAYLEEQF